jgi:hypothetical protein
MTQGAAAPTSEPRSSAAWQPDFDWLTDELAVGGRFPMPRAVDLARDHSVRAIVDLREEDCDDASLLAASGIAFMHLPTTDMFGCATDTLDRGVAFARGHIDRGERVLIHCQHGIGRSALLALCVLVDLGFEPLAALTLAKDRRAKVSPSLHQYQGWVEWLRSRRITPPDYHSFGCIAYRHLAGS